MRPIRRSLQAMAASVIEVEHHTARTDDATTVAALQIQKEALQKDLKAVEDMVAYKSGWMGLLLVAIGGITGGYLGRSVSLAFLGGFLGFVAGAKVAPKEPAELVRLRARIRECDERIKEFNG